MKPGDPSWGAEMDQMLAGLRDIAKISRGYYLELVEQGFTDAEALRLVIAWQSNLAHGQTED